MNSRRTQDLLPRRLVRFSIRRPALTLALWALAGLAAALGILRLEIETSTESVLDRNSPEWAYYQESLDLFGGDEVLVVAFLASGEDEAATLEAVRRISSEAEGIDGVRRVDSISTFPIVDADQEGTILLDPALDRKEPVDRASALSAKSTALGDRVAPRTLLSEDGETLAINLVLEEKPSEHYETIVSRVEALARKHLGHSTPIWISGVPIFQSETSLQTREELVRLAPASAVAMWLLISVAFRSPKAGAFVMVVAGLSVAVMLAAIGLTGTRLSFPMVILPPLILALAAAYSMHMLSAASSHPSEKPIDEQSLQDLLPQVAIPLSLSGVTTAIGFAASSFAGIEAIRNVAAFGSLGALTTAFAVLTALPAMMSATGGELRQTSLDRALSVPIPSQLADHARRRRKAIVLAWFAGIGVALAASLRVDIDTDATRWFTGESKIRQDYEEIRSRLSGISPINVVIQPDPLDEPSTLLTPETLQAMRSLQTHLASVETVGKSTSIVDPILQLHERLSGPEQGFPASSSLLEQYLLVLESADHIDDLITRDRLALNLVMRLDNNGSAQILEVADIAERWWTENGPQGTQARATGIMFEFARAQDAIARSQIFSLSIAAISVLLILAITFGSARTALIAAIPNFAPLALIYGVMGVFRVPLDAGTVLVGSLALGVAVDDTIHLVAAHTRALRRHPPEEAVRKALETTLAPIVYTTIAVGIGFSIVALSGFTFIRNLGLLMALAMAACLVADVHLLPALLSRLSTRHDPTERRDPKRGK